jgi:hypothetical protein
MNNTLVVNAMLITLATEHPFAAEMPRCVLGALCAINMLLAIDDDLLSSRAYTFADFTIAPLANRAGTRVTFADTIDYRDIDVDRSALQHLKANGSWRDLRLFNRQSKL